MSLKRSVLLVLFAISTPSVSALAAHVPTSEAALPAMHPEVLEACKAAPTGANQDVVYEHLERCSKFVLYELKAHTSEPAQLIALLFHWDATFRQGVTAAFPGRPTETFSELEQRLTQAPSTGNVVIDKVIKMVFRSLVAFTTSLSRAFARAALGVFETTTLELPFERFRYLDAVVTRTSTGHLQPHLDQNLWKQWEQIFSQVYPYYSSAPPHNLNIR